MHTVLTYPNIFQNNFDKFLSKGDKGEIYPKTTSRSLTVNEAQEVLTVKDGD